MSHKRADGLKILRNVKFKYGNVVERASGTIERELYLHITRYDDGSVALHVNVMNKNVSLTGKKYAKKIDVHVPKHEVWKMTDALRGLV